MKSINCKCKPGSLQLCNHCSAQDKNLRSEIQNQIEEYIANGGKIKEIRFGISGEYEGRKIFNTEIKNPIEKQIKKEIEKSEKKKKTIRAIQIPNKIAESGNMNIHMVRDNHIVTVRSFWVGQFYNRAAAIKARDEYRLNNNMAPAPY